MSSSSYFFTTLNPLPIIMVATEKTSKPWEPSPYCLPVEPSCLVLPKTSPTPRLPALPTRVSPFEPRPVGTVPECVPLPRHTLDEDSPPNGNLSRAGDCCGEGGLLSSRRWHDHRPASRTGQGGSCSSSARNSRSLPYLKRTSKVPAKRNTSPLRGETLAAASASE